jgi:lipopolysaccharide export system protein LptA
MMRISPCCRRLPRFCLPTILLTGIFSVAGMLLSQAAYAEKADRDKPANIEADKVTVDDQKQTQVFEGNVQMIKGTIVFRAERVVITQDADGNQHSVATGGAKLPYFRQKREGLDEYIEGEAVRIEHWDKNDKTDLYERAWVKSGSDEVHGQFISYDGQTDTYLVTNGPAGTVAKPGSGSRVRAVVQPKTKPGAPPANGQNATAKPQTAPAAGGIKLESAKTLETPVQESHP